MANLIAVAGQSGCGKSTSLFPNEELKIKGLDPKETVFINVAGKPLPVRGANKLYPKDKKITEGGNYVEIESAAEVGRLITFVSENRKDIKDIVIDDAGYTMAFEAIKEAKNKGLIC